MNTTFETLLKSLEAMIETPVAALNNKEFWVPESGDLVYGFDFSGHDVESIVTPFTYNEDDRVQRNAFSIGLIFKTREQAEAQLIYMNVETGLRNYPQRITHANATGYGFMLLEGTLMIASTDTHREELAGGYVFPTIDDINKIVKHMSAKHIAIWAQYCAE